MLFGMETAELWEVASYVVTVIGLPLAIIVFLYEQRKERQSDDEEIFQYLSEEYVEFLKLVLQNADLGLMRDNAVPPPVLNAEQRERKQILYDILMSIFERAYMLVYEDDMNHQTARLWASWEDYIRQWCRRADFRALLPELLEGEDQEFTDYMLAISAQEAEKQRDVQSL